MLPSRRRFLRSAAVCISLPLLDAFRTCASAESAKRMLLIGRPLGIHTPFFFPEKAGKDYAPSRYLAPLQEFRDDFTVFSGMSHRGYAGHGSEAGLLTGASPDRIRQGDVRNTVSIDQEVASQLGAETRYASLALGGGDLSWNRRGIRVPSESEATKVFKQLFIDGTPAEVAREIQKIKNGQSILDGVRDQAKTLATSLSASDRDRLDLLLSSIREAEQRLQQDQAWVLKPKPEVPIKPFTDDHMTDNKLPERERQWYDLAHLALQTNSTRVISLYLWSHGEHLNLPGVTLTCHDASHHGQDEAKIKQLALIEETELTLFGEFLAKMKATNENGQSLLDQTVVLHTSNLGNASAHTCDNLPIILAGGGFKHAGHLAYNRKDNMPLSNLYVRMLQQMGLRNERFGSSTGILGDV